MRLSALVCVQNQDAQLSACLRSLAFCDQVVVVADRCTDRTQEVARRQGVTLIEGIFPLENQRKAAGLAACDGDWILEIDPDEQVDRALAWEIRAALQLRPQGDYFEIPVDNYVTGALVRNGWTGALSAGRAVRLYKPGVKRWKPLRLDADLILAGEPAGALTGAIRRDLGDLGGLLERLNRLTALRAEDLADADGPDRPARGLLRACRQFARSYVAMGGWREGRLGLLVALLSALCPVVSQMRARETLEARRVARTAVRRPRQAPEVVRLTAG